ncbi:MAG: PAS domain S-box protein, partial [Spirochaetia bacterium]|nr:PAS domain S-box protein [Spirochaetia bacterium]
NGTIQLANSKFAELTGYPLEEIQKKKTWMDFASAEDFPKMMEQHKLRRRDGEKALKEYEFTLVDKYQHKKNIRLFIDIIPGTNNSIASLLDISEQRRLEEDLRNTIGLLSSLVNSIPDLIFYKSPEGFYQGCNPSFEQFIGKNEKEIIGKTDYDLFDKETADFFRFHDKTMFAQMKAARNEEWITYPDGEKVLLETIKAPYKNADGKLIGLIGIGRNITARRKANDEKENLTKQLQHIQKLESIGRLAGGVAHDFNNMLSVITGFTDLSLEQIQKDNPIYSHLAEVKNAAQRSVDITKKLLAFARKQNIEPKKIDLNKTLENMLNMLRRLIGENIKLDWVPDDKLWPIQADPSQIDQIITNLCINGRDAIEGEGEISIETKNISLDEEYCANHIGFLPGDFVVITVTDNGCGMDKETQSNIFEPFFTTKEVGKGSGLGLSTVYGIVKQNKGFINIYSEIGGGTSFRVYLPRYADTSKEYEPSPHHTIPKGNRESILIVEDEQSIRMLTKWMLEKLNYSVIIADSAENAISIAVNHEKNIDMLITDVVMPEMNGRDLSERLKKVVPQLKVLYMSGYTANVIVHKGILENGLHFMQKPFSQFDIAVKVRETLDDTQLKI